MSDLDDYLSNYFQTAEQFSQSCGIDVNELFQLIESECIPAASYVVNEQGSVHSFVFGEMAAPDSKAGYYFHPANHVWVALAISTELNRNASALRVRFTKNFATALSDFNQSLFHLADSFTVDGAVINEGLKARTDTAWLHFLKGTFGLCIANPVSEYEIARKEILQEKLSLFSENGAKANFTAAESDVLIRLIDDYAAASMPFSPIEYTRSSRKRLVDDLRPRLIHC